MTVKPRINACFESPKHGLFLTCTEGIFSFYIKHAHTLERLNIHELFRGEKPLLGMAALLTWLHISILTGPFLESTASF
jgi:hypothetical protein